MIQTYRLIQVECREEVFYVRLTKTRLDECEIQDFGEEMLSLADRDGRSAALSLGPDTPRCLFSVLLSRLVVIRNGFRRRGGELVLCQVGPQAYSAFTGCSLQGEFVFLADFDAAVRYFEARREKDRPA